MKYQHVPVPMHLAHFHFRNLMLLPNELYYPITAMIPTGRGLRTLVARACTGFVSVPGGGASVINDDDEEESETQAGVDSLNVSVTGDILLWHFLSKSS